MAVGEAPARAVRRSLGPWPVAGILAALAVVYVGLRLWSVLSVHEVWGAMPDSAGYRTPAGQPGADLISLRGNAVRPWVVPATYALAPNDGMRAGLQVLASIGAWLALAATVARQLVRPALAVIGFVAVLALGCSWPVIIWDLAILSESLTLSLSVALVAAWLAHLRSPRWWSAAAVVATSTLWVFTRVQHVPVLAITVVVAVLLVRRPSGRAVAAVTAGGLVVATLWAGATIDTQDRAYAARDGLGVSLFGETFALNLRFTILRDPEATEWFVAQGMPRPHGLEPFLRPGTIHVDAWETWPDFYARYRADDELRAWVETDGRSVFSRYVTTHLPALAGRFATDADEILAPPASSLGYAFPAPILPPPVAAVVFPDGGPVRVRVPLALAGATAVVLAWRRRWPPNRLLAGVGAFVAVVSVPALFLAWLGSPVEYTRHAVPFVVLLPLGLLLVLLAAGDDPPEVAPADVAGEGGLRRRRSHP